MSRQRRIARRTVPDDSPVVTALECVDAGEFPSESAGDVASAIGSASPRTDARFPDEEIVLRDDASTSTHGLEAFLAEDQAPAPSQARFEGDEFRNIDDAHDHDAREVDVSAPQTASVRSGIQARGWVSTSMMLLALSASFFIGVVLEREVLERINPALFTSAGTPGSAPVAARPMAVLAAPAPHATAVESHLASIEPASALPPLSAPSIVGRATAEERGPGAVAKAALEASPAPAPLAVQTVAPTVAPERDSVVLPTAPGRTAAPVPPSAPLAPAPLPAAAASLDAPSPAAPSPAAASGVAAPPPAPVARPISAEPSVAPPPPRVPTEADQIGRVLTRYRGAFNALDPAAARGVWPSVDERALSRAFAGLAQQEVDFQHCDIDVDGARAAARCTGRARYVPKVGNRTPQTAARSWRFDLQKVDDRWLIAAVDAR